MRRSGEWKVESGNFTSHFPLATLGPPLSFVQAFIFLLHPDPARHVCRSLGSGFDLSLDLELLAESCNLSLADTS